MNHRRHRILHDTGLLLHIPGAMAVVSVPVALLAGHEPSLAGFVVAAAAGLGAGQILKRRFRSGDGSDRSAAMIVAAGSWLLVSVIGALPLWIAGVLGPEHSEAAKAYAKPVNALFEGFSGFTSCGLTLSGRPDLLPVPLQWWRSLMEWVGGVGVILLAMAVTEPAEDRYALYRQESANVSRDNDRRPGTKARKVWALYAAMTAVAVAVFAAVGMPLWEAVNHGLTGMSTGGFSITRNSFADYGPGTRLAAMGVMMLGAVSFRVHAALWLRRDGAAVRRNTQLRWLAALLLAGPVLFVLVPRLPSPGTGIGHVAFQWVSALCTCGFSSDRLATWPAAGLLLLTAAMLIGGASGSTAGGLKVGRAGWIARGLARRVRGQVTGREDFEGLGEDGRVVPEEEALRRILSAALFLVLSLLVLGAAWLVLLVLLPDQPAQHVLFEAVSALGSVGLSTGITGAEMPAAAKLLLAALMWMGRLEIMAVLVLVLSPLGHAGPDGRDESVPNRRRGAESHVGDVL